MYISRNYYRSKKYIALTTEPQCVYGIYCPGGSFDLRHRWATKTNNDIVLVNDISCIFILSMNNIVTIATCYSIKFSYESYRWCIVSQSMKIVYEWGKDLWCSQAAAINTEGSGI